MKVTGKVVQAPFGPGVYLLETDDGRRFALQGGDDALLTEGVAATVEGEVADDAVGIGMTGDPVLRVRGYELIG